MTDEQVWFRVILPPDVSTGGITQTMYCLICGAAVVVTQHDSFPAELHKDWHTTAGELPDAPD